MTNVNSEALLGVFAIFNTRKNVPNDIQTCTYLAPSW